ncbi:uncharacterized protein HMPREF1541_06927 [Cyphellophora europaea CBS 101466]|uniref:Heterokaryon incompatibility domain-containing protein n=1 Tax=Cyphellophora europaea (strain CBS 101466) TaxID=1220924 RepID=W2RQW8_CYPE1|nr:uncharacterized protein HMPREF1541_06927 [Cyphellophora europaea CBS 101466]ETN38886.1 hypothetical protein HMPREF1541_06927 [Cyphellophora europaea CBS 101466]
MRLIDTRTLELADFGNHLPSAQYAILSHRWGDNEVTYRQYMALDKSLLRAQTPRAYSSGLDKILWGCHMARRNNLRYFWIDTCCINKNNEDDQTELSASVMSMWKWYHEAAICYIFLATITLSAAEVERDPNAFMEWHHSKDSEDRDYGRPAEYFRRGWTLQELLAPRRAIFFNATWSFIGSRLQLVDQIYNATNIAKQYINSNEGIRLASIAARLSWAGGRETTREEDRVYSLIGLFDINMDIRYGEGYERAFYRLQKEIVENDPSEDIFAWTSDKLAKSGLLAPDIDCFANSGDIDRIWTQDKEPHQLTSKGLRLHITARLWEMARESAQANNHPHPTVVLPLAAGRRNKQTKEVEVVTIMLVCMNYRESPTRMFVREHCDRLGFEASTAAAATSLSASSTRDSKRRSQLMKADEYISIFVRQEYSFNPAHRKKTMELMRQRFGSFGREFKAYVYEGRYTTPEAVPEGRVVNGGSLRRPRSPSPHIGYAM